MKIHDYISITELSRATGKSRPTLYKYISDYENSKYNDIPYLFLQLFDKIRSDKFTRTEILAYCEKVFQNKCVLPTSDPEFAELIELITDNRDRLNLGLLKHIISEELKNGKK